MCCFSSLEDMAHYKAKNQNTVKINHARAHTHTCTHTHTCAHTQTLMQLEGVRFERWFERCKCFWWSFHKYHSLYFLMCCHTLCFHMYHSMSATVFSPLLACVFSSANILPTSRMLMEKAVLMYVIMQYHGGWKKKWYLLPLRYQKSAVHGFAATLKGSL